LEIITKCTVCGSKDPSILGCGKIECPFPRSVDLREKWDAYKKRVVESRQKNKRFAG